MEDITGTDYVHAKRDRKNFEIKNSQYHDLYGRSNTLLLADVFETLRSMRLKLYERDPEKFVPD